MKLAELINEKIFSIEGDAQVDIRGVTADSRKVQKGYLFFALKGTSAHGIQFAEDAVSRGAVAVVTDENVSINGSVTVYVKDARAAYAKAAARFYGEPSLRLEVLLVTGTNGKSTVVYLLQKVVSALGEKSAYVGTLGAVEYPGKIDLTTPDAAEFQKLLRWYADSGYRYVFAEASSHALDQKRIDCVYPRVCVFTNLSHDHLDYHTDMDTYFKAKARLFQEILRSSPKKPRFAVINADDPYGQRLMQMLENTDEVVTYGIREKADVKGFVKTSSLKGLRLCVSLKNAEFEVESPLIGEHNAYNLLAVVASLPAFGIDPVKAAPHFRDVPPPPGRLENAGASSGKFIFVDYAHTPDALEKVLSVLRSLTRGRLIVVFGCGGDRDREKRPQMGRIAEELADVVVVTSDNPRSEDPFAIIRDILQGMKNPSSVTVEENRRKAIQHAVGIMRKDDVLLIAGKGHEDYQIIGDKRIHFDDREEVTKALQGSDESQ